ncbi:MAG: STAS domain-containing protein [Bacteroidota bacterium]
MYTLDYNPGEQLISVAFTGRMDTLIVEKFVKQLEAESVIQNRKPGDKIVFNLGEVDYIASSFIRVCISYAKLAGPGGFSIANCQPFVKKTFKISGLDEVLNIK